LANAKPNASSFLPFTIHHSPFTSHFSPLTPAWTLFLDRDGVINKKIDDDYVRSTEQFEWLPGVQEAMKKLATLFGKVIIVSNQQGVGKGLMTTNDVESIHQHISETIASVGGRIDRIYYAPQLKAENSTFRKPNTGMAHEAKKDFPEIDFSKSIMVGDSISDMEFGKGVGMKTVYILNGKQLPDAPDLIDGYCENLAAFADWL
jgi:histidinol-phosphate phosphatase family protein